MRHIPDCPVFPRVDICGVTMTITPSFTVYPLSAIHTIEAALPPVGDLPPVVEFVPPPDVCEHLETIAYDGPDDEDGYPLRAWEVEDADGVVYTVYPPELGTAEEQEAARAVADVFWATAQQHGELYRAARDAWAAYRAAVQTDRRREIDRRIRSVVPGFPVVEIRDGYMATGVGHRPANPAPTPTPAACPRAGGPDGGRDDDDACGAPTDKAGACTRLGCCNSD